MAVSIKSGKHYDEEMQAIDKRYGDSLKTVREFQDDLNISVATRQIMKYEKFEWIVSDKYSLNEHVWLVSLWGLAGL